MKVAFEVEQAGCASCAERVRGTLAPLGAVEQIEIDEGADMARVVLEAPVDADQSLVDRALVEASAGASHVYRVRHGSWHEL